MTGREILVVFDAAASVPRLMAPAAGVAGMLSARLTGMFATGYPIETAYGDVSGWMQLVETYLAAQRAEASAAEAAYRQELAARQLTGEWLLRETDATASAAAAAALYDLVVLGQPDPDAGSPGALGLRPEAVVLSAGRPVLLVPYAGRFERVGRRVLVAWNGSREAARALHDAMLLFAAAEAVTVIEVAAGPAAAGTARVGAAEVAAALRRRGVAAASDSAEAGGIAIDELLLSRAADYGADLLVMGAYGHSRLREYVLGGVSRGIFRHMTVPVLMAH